MRLSEQHRLILAGAVALLAIVQLIVQSPVVGIPLALLSLALWSAIGRDLGWDRPGTAIPVMAGLAVALVILVLIGGDDAPMIIAILQLLLATAFLAALLLLILGRTRSGRDEGLASRPQNEAPAPAERDGPR